jgi:hypothetical protein
MVWGDKSGYVFVPLTLTLSPAGRGDTPFDSFRCYKYVVPYGTLFSCISYQSKPVIPMTWNGWSIWGEIGESAILHRR